MNNFFYCNSDYDLFKKALRSTKNEPVVINILSDDSSLQEVSNTGNSSMVVRKQMSSKFQASPFDKFFGPRKKRTDPLDMKDFSSWKNKNYRESEKQINDSPEEIKMFSFSDYLNSKAKTDKFNEEDKLKSESQKSIDQISAHDEDYKRFSLDSYLNKLEQETKARKSFAESEDLIDIDSFSDDVMKDTVNQDENFSSNSSVDIEDFTFDGNVSGEKFSFDKEELDSFKARLEKKAREENNIKDKPTTKIISTDEINELKGKTDEDDEFDLDKLGVEDDIERVNQKLDSISKLLQDASEKDAEKPKISGKRFVEINKNFDENEFAKPSESVVSAVEENDENNLEQDEVSDGGVDFDADSENQEDENKPAQDDDLDAGDADQSEADEPIEQKDDLEETNQETERKSGINKNAEFLTKADFRDFTEEIVNKLSEMYRENPAKNDQGVDEQVDPYGQQFVDGGYAQPTGYVQPYAQTGMPDVYAQQSDLHTKIVELIEQNKKSDQEVAEKLRLAEMEKQRVEKEYETKLQELESSIRQREEEAKRQAYIEKLKADIKLKKSETKFKQREDEIRESEKLSSEKQYAGEKLKTELKNSLNVSNLEMDKKLLECVGRLHKDFDVTLEPDIVDDVEEIEETEQVKKPVRTRTRSTRTNRTTRRRSTVNSRMRTRVPRRKIDSDIIGGINFD